MTIIHIFIINNCDKLQIKSLFVGIMRVFATRLQYVLRVNLLRRVS